jgi:F-type H+-transporting ATPase subunit alpha
MKQVGGTLKLDLAQYREMAAFAQFASDLDPASQRLLNRGARLTEMLKQDQYSPLPVEKEVLIIFAGNEGYFDKLPLEQVKPFERALYQHFDARHGAVLDEIRTRREISDELRKKLVSALDAFAQQFATEHADSAGAQAA